MLPREKAVWVWVWDLQSEKAEDADADTGTDARFGERCALQEGPAPVFLLGDYRRGPPKRCDKEQQGRGLGELNRTQPLLPGRTVSNSNRE